MQPEGPCTLQAQPSICAPDCLGRRKDRLLADKNDFLQHTQKLWHRRMLREPTTAIAFHGAVIKTGTLPSAGLNDVRCAPCR